MAKDKITIEITKKDKIYLSVIFALVCLTVCLAICLPRPYKFIEKEVVVYTPQHIKVYETETCHIISPMNTLYDSVNGYYEDANNNKYVIGFEKTYVETGKFNGAEVSVITDQNGVDNKHTIELTEALTELFVFDKSQNGFGVKISLDYYIMQNVENLFKTNLGADKIDILQDYLFSFNFENAEVYIIVSFLSE